MANWSFFADWHTHTCYSDGKGSIAANARAGQVRSLQQVAITDHAPASLGVGLKQPEVTLQQMRTEIEAWNKTEVTPQLLLGAETNIISQQGDLDLPKRLLKDLDVVIASLHPLVKPLTLKDGVSMLLPNLVQRYTPLRSRKLRNINTKAMVEAVYRYPIDFVAHPGLWIDIDTLELANACVRRGTTRNKLPSHTDILAGYVQAAMPTGVDFVISSDAHEPSLVGDLDAGLELARRLQLPLERIRNLMKG